MDKNMHSGHRARLRETMTKNGLDNMQPHQVLEYMLSFVVARKDTNPIAHNLIHAFGSFDAVFEATIDELTRVEGVGIVTATFLHSFLSFVEYYNNHRVKKIESIQSPMTAVVFAYNLLKGRTTEALYAILLDPQGYVLDYKKMAQGTISSVNVKIRDITKYALSHNASQVVVCHNHPDADSMPSIEDQAFTDRLREALTPNSITLEEHVVVGNSDCYSFKSGYKITLEMINEYILERGEKENEKLHKKR